MTDNFPAFSKITRTSLQALLKTDSVFVIGLTDETIFDSYLSAFPSGTNPTFRTRTEHDCACCRQFVRRVGKVVTVNEDGSLKTIWDEATETAPEPYRSVATSLRDLVRASPISDLFRVAHNEASFGVEQTRSLSKETGNATTHNHFFSGEIPKSLRSATPDQVRGDYRTTVQVFERGLSELKAEAVSTVIDLIDANGLYRGAEHRTSVVAFQKAQTSYSTTPEGTARTAFLWKNAVGPATRFRNTVIGTLITDLSEGMDLERAVGAFEAKVAPQNYKRTTALITPAMVKKAMAEIEALGLESALERRFARIEDISVRDVLWVDSTERPLMKGGLGEVLMKSATSVLPDESKATSVKLDDFAKMILPTATGLEAFFKAEHQGNLMALTAPVHPEPKQLFRWTNDFAWSYEGNVADSIKERVKKAGGNVTNAVLRISLSWFNYDDLDLHVYEPAGRGIESLHNHINFRTRKGWTGGELDVDMNAGAGKTRNAVENVAWQEAPPDGLYRVIVNNFTQRETNDVGFTIEVESGGKLSQFSYNKAVRDKQDIHVVSLHVKGGRVESFEVGDPGISTSAVSQERWGLQTESFAKVSAITLSPNFWGDNKVGNMHTFFALKSARPEGAMRGIYNEFLHPRLAAHRKVFEVIGDKTKCLADGQGLAGLGFSSTKKDSLLMRASQGKKQRLYDIQIG